ncbi:chaplin family protein [Streptomyces sp. NPDC059680]|uniref:chaplin n=1 Tax=Streptomyces sp. NPDC059680 TaxID=3346904 RepID=UPI0036C73C25
MAAAATSVLVGGSEAYAASQVQGATLDSHDALSGNTVELPTDLQANVCGNAVNATIQQQAASPTVCARTPSEPTVPLRGDRGSDTDGSSVIRPRNNSRATVPSLRPTTPNGPALYAPAAPTPRMPSSRPPITPPPSLSPGQRAATTAAQQSPNRGHAAPKTSVPTTSAVPRTAVPPTAPTLTSALTPALTAVHLPPTPLSTSTITTIAPPAPTHYDATTPATPAPVTAALTAVRLAPSPLPVSTISTPKSATTPTVGPPAHHAPAAPTYDQQKHEPNHYEATTLATATPLGRTHLPVSVPRITPAPLAPRCKPTVTTASVLSNSESTPLRAPAPFLPSRQTSTAALPPGRAPRMGSFVAPLPPTTPTAPRTPASRPHSERAGMASTGTEMVLSSSAAAFVLLTAGAILYRRGRATSHK